MKEIKLYLNSLYTTERVSKPVYSLTLATTDAGAQLQISGESADVYAMGVSPEAAANLDNQAATDMFYYLAAQNFPSTMRVEMSGVTADEIVKYLMENFSEDELKSIFTR